MAKPTTCSTCGELVPPKIGSQVGPRVCPNPECGKPIPTVEEVAPAPAVASTAARAPARVPAPASRPARRPPDAPPELLDKLPPSFATSPAMVVGGSVFLLLYGVVLFTVVSARARSAREEEAKALAVSRVERPVDLPPPAEPPPGRESRKPQPNHETPDPRPSPEKFTGTPSIVSPSPPPTEPTPERKRPRSRNKNPSARAPSDPPPAPTPPPPPTPPPSREVGWSGLVGQSGDCSFHLEDAVYTATVPGSLHVLSPELSLRNAPRLLTEVTGDFVAQVKVTGRILPGTIPLAGLPFTFQGAGLLVWRDENNYLRFERTSSYLTRAGKKLDQVLLEVCRDGQTLPMAPPRDVREADLLLRLERRKQEIRCSYSPDDGKTWLEIKRQPVKFPDSVSVGISASNASPKPFPAHFQDFRLSKPGATVATPVRP